MVYEPQSVDEMLFSEAEEMKNPCDEYGFHPRQSAILTGREVAMSKRIAELEARLKEARAGITVISRSRDSWAADWKLVAKNAQEMGEKHRNKIAALVLAFEEIMKDIPIDNDHTDLLWDRFNSIKVTLPEKVEALLEAEADSDALALRVNE